MCIFSDSYVNNIPNNLNMKRRYKDGNNGTNK